MSQTIVDNQHTEEHITSTGLSNRKLLMWTFLGSDVMFFGDFIATYLVYRGKSLNGPYQNEIGATVAYIKAPDNVRIEILQLPAS